MTSTAQAQMPEANKETYVGDGVYVCHDGYQLWLRTGDDEYTGIQRIALDPAVFRGLVDYAKQFGTHFTG